jgi:hypothetical protein
MPAEELGVLKEKPVTGSRVQHELSIGKLLGHHVGVIGRNYEVMVAICYQDRLRYFAQARERGALAHTPRTYRHELRLEALDSHVRNWLLFALPKTPKMGDSSAAPFLMLIEKQIKKILVDTDWLRHDLHGFVCHFRRIGYAAGAGRRQNEATHLVWALQREALSDAPPQRPAQDIDAIEGEFVEK